MTKIYRNIGLGIEFILLFFGLPLFIFFYSNIIHPSAILIPVLLCLIFYFGNKKDFKFYELIKFDISIKERIWNTFILLSVGLLMIIGVDLFDRENLFNLPKFNTHIWLLICFLYPIFSAFAQEVIYRSYLFERYRPLFKNKWLLIFVSGIAFSFVHIIYYNELSIILTFLAGIYLAYVYERTKSVLFTSIIHGILGDLIFTVGLGQYFWLDMSKWL